MDSSGVPKMEETESLLPSSNDLPTIQRSNHLPPQEQQQLMRVAIFVWFNHNLCERAAERLSSVRMAWLNLLTNSAFNGYPNTVLPEPAARYYNDLAPHQPDMLARLNLFECLVIDSMLTWSDLLPDDMGDMLCELRAAVNNLVTGTTIDLPAGYSDSYSRYLNLRQSAARLTFDSLGLEEPQWRRTLGSIRHSVEFVDKLYMLDRYQDHWRANPTIADIRIRGHSRLFIVAQLVPSELQNRPDSLRYVLTRLDKMEIGTLIHLGLLCQLPFLGFLLYYTLRLSQRRGLPLQQQQPSSASSWALLSTLRSLTCSVLNFCRPGSNWQWTRVSMMPRRAVLTVDSMPGLAPTARCCEFCSFTGVTALQLLSCCNVWPTAFAASGSDRRKMFNSATDDQLLDVFRQQLSARSVGAIIVFVDAGLQELLTDGTDEFVSKAIGLVSSLAAERSLLVLWCLESASPDRFLASQPGADRRRLFRFGRSGKPDWRVWRELLQQLNSLAYNAAGPALPTLPDAVADAIAAV